MKVLYFILIVIISLLSIAAGGAKVISEPQEIKFLQSFGLNNTLILTYGLFQILGGLLLTLLKTRKFGAIITMLAFALSSLLIFIDGNLMFGLVSLIPVLLTGLIYWLSSKISKNSIEQKKVT